MTLLNYELLARYLFWPSTLARVSILQVEALLFSLQRPRSASVQETLEAHKGSLSELLKFESQVDKMIKALNKKKSKGAGRGSGGRSRGSGKGGGRKRKAPAQARRTPLHEHLLLWAHRPFGN